jgi:hypothetical protein
MSKVLSGILSLSNTVKTLGFDAVTYTGNGTTQDIVTGISSVDFTVASNGSGYWLDRTVNQVKTDAGAVVASGELKLILVRFILRVGVMLIAIIFMMG